MLTISPSKIRLNKTGVVISLTGSASAWVSTNPTFTISSLSGTSKTGQSITTNTVATITLNTGATAGVITVTDPSTGDTANVRITGVAVPFVPGMYNRGR